MSTTAKYPIPLYLNQKYVFDLLAMMEDGLSQLQTVKSTHASNQDISSKYSGEIGVKNVFAFLGVSLGGDRSKTAQSGETKEIVQERVHTPNSLFSKVRDRLRNEGMLKELTSAVPGQFVEFQATLRKNPLIDAIESFRSLVGTALVFEQPAPKPQNQKQGKQNRLPEPTGEQQLFMQFDSLLEQLRGTGSLDLIGTVSGAESTSLVLTVDVAFLADPTMSDLVDGKYTILGKVTNVLIDGEEDSINLLRKTSLGRVQGQMLEQMKDAFSEASLHGIDLPELVTEIRGPAVQVLPISIYA